MDTTDTQQLRTAPNEPATYVARQPIADREHRIVAYELLFRSGLENVFPGTDADEASSRVITDGVLGGSVDAMTGGLPVFVNVSRRLLLEDLVSALSPGRVVIELLETIRPDPEVLAACRRLREQGYRLALDDYAGKGDRDELLDVVDILKVDFRALARAERQAVARRHAGSGLVLLAEKLESPAEFREAFTAGYDLFQGHFLSAPEVIASRDVPPTALAARLFLEVLERPDVDVGAAEELLRRDVGLAVRFLRFLRSRDFRWPERPRGFRDALEALGKERLRRWASLLALHAGGPPFPAPAAGSMATRVRDDLVRARACELIARRLRTADGERDLTPFLVGLVSGLQRMLGRPLGLLLEEMSLPDPVVEALLEGGTPAARVLSVCLALEAGDLTELERRSRGMGVPATKLAEAWFAAGDWADAGVGG